MSQDQFQKLIDKIVAEKLQQQEAQRNSQQSLYEQLSQLLNQQSSSSSSTPPPPKDEKQSSPLPVTPSPTPASTPKASPIERYEALKKILGDKIPKEVQARYAYETHIFMGGDPEITLESFRNPAVIKRPTRPEDGVTETPETPTSSEQPLEKKQKTIPTKQPETQKEESSASALDITNNVLSTLGV